MVFDYARSQLAKNRIIVRTEVLNRARGGRSSKSYYENHWDDVKASVQEGDFVFIQFGINDRAQDEERRAPTGGVFEGYMAHFAEETRELGATPIFVTTVRRNQWRDADQTEVSTDYIYEFDTSAMESRYQAVFNNSEGLGSMMTNLTTEFDDTNIVLNWSLENFSGEITGVEIYRND